VACTADIGHAPTLHVFKSAALHFWRSGLGGLNSRISGLSGYVRVHELIVQPLVPEVSLFFGNPFLEASVRLNAEFAHTVSLLV
jgi:hypothetical protein